MASLVLISEDDSERQIFPLGRATLMVGRDDASQIRLPDGSISRNHASIVYEANQFVVRDNGSTNGTFVNGKRVSRLALAHNDIVRFGNYTFLFNMEDGSLVEGSSKIRPPALKAEHTDPIPVETGTSGYRTVVRLKPKATVASGKAIPRSTDVELRLTEPVVRALPKIYPPIHPAAFEVLSLAALICGCMGFITFLPAIILGHIAHPKDPRHRLHKRLGLSLGYSWLFIWIGAVILFWKGTYIKETFFYPPTTQPIRISKPMRPPQITAGLPLLSGPLVWTPFQDALSSIFASEYQMGEMNLPATTTLTEDKARALSDFRTVWKNGVIIYQPDLIRVDNEPNPQNTIRFILEDCKSQTTFTAGSSFNSTVIPEKKAVVGPFYLPQMGADLFYNRNPRLSSEIGKFNQEDFPWRMAERGIQWSMNDLSLNSPEEAHLLRWIIFLKSAIEPSVLVIVTKEGNLLRDYPKQYEFKLFPSEVLAEAVYVDSTDVPLSIRVNETLYSSEEAVMAKAMIETNFKSILLNRPRGRLEIPRSFQLSASPPSVTAKKK